MQSYIMPNFTPAHMKSVNTIGRAQRNLHQRKIANCSIELTLLTSIVIGFV